MKSELILCQCGDIEHQLVIQYDESDKEIILNFYLSPYRSFWSRIKYAIKYIFGYRSKYGAFDSIIFNNDDGYKFQQIADWLNNSNQKLSQCPCCGHRTCLKDSGNAEAPSA